MPRRRPSPIALVAAACAGASAWFSAGALAVIDAAPRAPRVGILPPLWVLPALIAVAVAIAWVVRLTTARTWPLFLPLLTVIPWLPGRLPLAALLWTGPIVLLVWTSAVVALAWSWPIRLPSSLAKTVSDSSRAPLWCGTIAFVLYVGAAAHLSFRVTGDEPHYLIITESLLRDFDLRIENNHRAAQYTSYFQGELKPDYLRRGRDGQIYSIHAPGVSVLIAPAFAFFGHYGAVVFIAIVCAAASALAWKGAAIVTGDAAAAWYGWAAVALTVPFFFQAFTIYPEGLGAAIVMCGVFALIDRDAPVHRWFWYGTALALLPWLHTRLAVAAAVIGTAIVLHLGTRADARKAIAAFVAVPLVSALGWFGYFYAIYGSANPAAPYAGNTQSSILNIGSGLAGLLIDQQFGILPHAPSLGVAMVGFVAFTRRNARLSREVLAVGVSYTLVAASFYMWWGGRSAPGRFLVAVLLPLALPAASAFAAARTRAARLLMIEALALSLATTAILLGPDGGRLIFNPRDGFALWAEWIAPLVDLPRALPSVLRDGAARALVDALVWVVSGGIAVFVVLRAERWSPLDRGRGAAACGALAIAAMIASSVLWRSRGVREPTATTAQVAVLRQASRMPHGTGVKFNPLQRVSVEAVAGRMEITASRRRPVEIDSPDLALLGMPAGEYRIRARSTFARLIARIGDSDVALHDWPLITPVGTAHLQLTLPVAVSTLDFRREPTSSPPPEMSVQAEAVAPRRSIGRASAAAGYGATRVFLIAGTAYFEEKGFWLTAGRSKIVVDPPARSLFLRNTNHDNVATVRASGFTERIELQSREERWITLPPSAEAHGEVAIDVSEGVVPATQEPGSRDYRNLGLWIEIGQYRTTPPK